MIDLGVTGKNVPIGIIEAVQRSKEYFFSCEVKSLEANLIKIRIEDFIKIISKSHNTVLAAIQANCEEAQNNLALKIMQQQKIKTVIKTQFN